ncbi:MAG TPA: hypothetical protein VKX33_09775, partial [Cyclobacteriaceae bacterium]|nr:hypothetical protein [Cyclobacteriaceae bacterium]
MKPVLAIYFFFQLIIPAVWGQVVPKEQVVLKESLLFALQEQHVHGSSIVSLPNGDLLTAWFQGSGERTADDVKILGSRLIKGSHEWSAPF